jgi:hypothetical protein
MRDTFVIFKNLPKVNSRPLGNLVTLNADHLILMMTINGS